MSDFEFLFALFGLLLGLSLAEVLSGLARAIHSAMRPGSALRIGWLTPLLGGFVLLDLLSFWGAAWSTRTIVAVSGPSLMAVLIFAGAYYLAAALVFPRDPDDQPDLDDHFFRVRRIVIGVMMTLLICQLGWYASVPTLAVRLTSPLPLALTATLVLLMVAALLVRSERATRLVMLAFVARYLIGYVLR